MAQAVTAKVLEKALRSVGGYGGQAWSMKTLAKGANDALAQAGITTRQGTAVFLAQCMVESAYFRTTEEYGGSEASYAPYFGRGFIQCTFKSNYSAFGHWCKARGLVDDGNYFVENPNRLGSNRWAWLTAVWYLTAKSLIGRANRGKIDEVGAGVHAGDPDAVHSWYPSDADTANAQYQRNRFKANREAYNALLDAGVKAPEPDYYDPPVDRSVKSIQRIVEVTVDGYYGEDTEKAVKKYQRTIGVTADGFWGTDTETAHREHAKKDDGGKKSEPRKSEKGGSDGIVSREEWGAKAWASSVYEVDPAERTHFLVHYHGGPPSHDHGTAMAKEVESIHLNNGWAGVGYNFLVGQDGVVYEGRGWDLVGAHCPGKNHTGIGVYVAVGGSQQPTTAAKRAVVRLFKEAKKRAGHGLVKGVHGDYYPTACAGKPLTRWVHSGMTLTGTAPTAPSTPDRLVNKFYQPVGVDMTVKQIQKAVGVTADGLYGKSTKGAVKREQRSLGVPVDGLWGPDTEKAWKKDNGTARIVVDGLLGPSTIARLQEVVGVTADGLWGPRTRKGLQKWLGVDADGIVGRRTVRALQRKVGARVDGIWGRDTTRALQRWLNKAGR